MLKILLALSLVTSAKTLPTESPKETYVYICNSTGATKYHLTPNCRGLNACDSKVIKVTKSEAINQGKKALCGWED